MMLLSHTAELIFSAFTVIVVTSTNTSLSYTVKPWFTNVSEFEQFGFQTEILN